MVGSHGVFGYRYLDFIEVADIGRSVASKVRSHLGWVVVSSNSSG